MTQPVAYVRKSTKGGKDSKSDQRANILDIIRRNGRPQDEHTVLWLDGDWGISAAREKAERRLDFARLIEMVRAGEVEHVYAYSADRLARDVERSATLLNAMADAGIKATTGERTWDPSDSMDRQQWHWLAMQNEGEVEKYQRKAGDREHRRRLRGDDFGYAPYGTMFDKRTHRLVARHVVPDNEGGVVTSNIEGIGDPVEDVTAVVEAYTRAGSFGGAAALLNGGAPELAERARPRRSGTWSDLTVARVVRRAGAASKAKARGWSKKRAETAAETFPLYRLIECPHDGSRLIGMRTKSGNGKEFNRYFCGRARQDPSHPRPYAVAESIILPWVVERIGSRRVETRRKTYGGNEDVAATRAALEDDRRRAGVAYMAKAINDDEFAAEVGRIDAAMADLPEDDIPPITVRFTSGSPRAMVERVVLDTAMRPTDIKWRTQA